MTIYYDPFLKKFRQNNSTTRPQSVTKAALITKRDAGQLEVGKSYLVTGCTFNTGTTVSVLLTATDVNKLSKIGFGKFYNPHYAVSGIYKGQWYSGMSTPSVNDIVVYNQVHYKSITGAIGTAPSSDTTNWSNSVNERTEANGYVIEWDIVKYDIDSDKFYYREDKRGNKVGGSLSYSVISSRGLWLSFQWGNDSVYGNIVESSNCSLLNWYGYLSGKTFSYNTLTNGASVTASATSLSMANCTVNNVSFNGTGSTATLTSCEFSGNTETLDFTSETATFTNNVYRKGYSNFPKTMTITGLTTLNPTTQNKWRWVGVGILSSSNSTETISAITNLPTNHPVKFYCATGLTVTFDFTAIASATTDSIVSASADTSIVGRVNGADEIVIAKDGTYNKVINIVKLV